MTSSFDRYEDELQQIMKQIETSIQDNNPPIMYCENLFQQANDLMKQMALEARSNTNNQERSLFLQKVQSTKQQLQSLQNDFNKYNIIGNNNRISSNGNFDQDGLLREQQQQRNKRNEDMLGQQNDTLERARRTMEETETIALEITDELSNNREKLMSTHNRIRDVSGLTGRARSILISMNQRSVQQKFMLYMVIGGLCFGFLILLWTMWG